MKLENKSEIRKFYLIILASVIISSSCSVVQERTADCKAEHIYFDFEYNSGPMVIDQNVRDSYINDLRKDLSSAFTFVDYKGNLSSSDVDIKVKLNAEILTDLEILPLELWVDVISPEGDVLWHDHFYGKPDWAIPDWSDSPKETAKITANKIIQACNNHWREE